MRPARLDDVEVLAEALGLVARVNVVDGVLEEDLGDLDTGAPCERLFGPLASLPLKRRN